MRPSTPFKKSPLAIAIHACCYSMLSAVSMAHAGPTGGQVVGGSGAISQSGTATTINQSSQNMAINWQSYNVNANERVQYIQPNASSISLNRILSNNGSTIAGRIDANGRVILVNPNGVFFTSSASLNVGSIIASGLDITPADFMNGQYVFHGIAGTSGTVVNSGMINASLGGNVALLGKQVESNGMIVANLGSVTLVSGKQAVLTFDNGGLLGVRVTEAMLQKDLGLDPAVLNSGSIKAQGGRVLLTASVSQDVFSKAVNTTGAEPATSVIVNSDGTLTLGSGADVLNSGSINTSATQANQNGGRIVMLGDNVTSSGSLKADAQSGNGGEIELHSSNMTLLTQNSVTSARAEINGQGGSVKVLGDKVGLFDNSAIDVSGANGGGQALIGGDLHGANTSIRNASATIVDRNASIFADALQNGDGGKVAVWADGNTHFLGSIFSRGGAASGNGGLAETSGKAALMFDGRVNLTAPQGQTGMLWLDPTNLVIRNNNAATLTTTVPNVAFGDATNAVTPASIRSVLGTTDITLQATQNITVTDAISAPSNTTTAHTLTLEAGDYIVVNNQISLGINNLTLIAGSAGCGASCSGTASRDITVNNPIYTSGNILLAAADNVYIYDAIGGASTPASLTVRAGNNITVDGVTGNNAGAIATNGAVTLTAADASLATSALTVAPSVTPTGIINVYGNVTTNSHDFTATTTKGYFNNLISGNTFLSGVSINSGTGKVSITADGNDNGNNLIINSGALLGKITAGSLDVTTTTGQIVQTTATTNGGDSTLNLNIANAATFNAGNNPIDLQNAANSLNGTITLTTTTGTTNNVSLWNSATTTTLGPVSVKGNLAINASRNLTLAGNITTAGTTDLNFGSGGASTFTASPGVATSTGGLLTVNGGASNDTFNIYSMFTGTLNGNRGTDTLRGPDAASSNQNNWQVTSTGGGTLLQSGTIPMQGTITFTGMENLTGGSGDDTFTINPSALAPSVILANIDTGNGTNIVTVNANSTVSGTITTGSGTNTVTVNGTVGSIRGDAGNGANTINVNAGGTVSGAITTGSGKDAFTIAGTVGGLLDGGAGADTLTVSAASRTVKLGSPVSNMGYLNVDHVETISSTGSGNTLLGQDNTASLTTWNVDAPSHGTVAYTSDITTSVTFNGFDNITGGSGNDTIVFTGSGALTGTFDGGLGTNTLHSRDAANTWTINGLNQGTLSDTATPSTPYVKFMNTQNLLGGNASDAFTFTTAGSIVGWIDGGGGAGDSVSLTALGSPVSVQWRDGANPVVNTSANLTIARVGSITANTNYNNTLIGDSTLTTTTWTLDSANHGNINNTLTFDGFRNLTGGSQNDTFTMLPGGSVTGLIDGGGGVNTLDMAALPVVSINLGNGIAGITRISQVIGNNTNSTLTGDNNGDTWSITGNNSGSVAGVTFRGFNYLIGGSGADTYTVTSNTGNTTYGTITGTITDNTGTNQLTVDLTNVNALVGNGQVAYLGGAADSVAISGTAPAGWSGSYTPTVGTTGDQIAYTNTASTFNVNYKGVGTVTDTASVANYRVNGTSGADTVTLDVNNNGANTVKINAALGLAYANKQNLILDGGAGVDTLLQKSGTILTLPSLTLANLENINNGTALNTNIDTLSIINSGAMLIKEQNALTLGPITTTNAIDITAGGAVDSIAALVSTAAFTVRSTGDITLVGNNSALSGPITLQQIGSLANPAVAASPTNTITLNNTSATTLAGINASNLYLTSTGNISDTGLVTVGNFIYLDTPGTITLKSMDHITTGSMKATAITLNTANGIGTVGGGTYINPAQVLATTTSKLDVTNKSGNVFIANQGAVSTSIITQGDINFNNNGNITVRQLNADGGNQVPAPSLGGNIYLSTVNGSAYGNPDPKISYLVTPDIVAQNFTGVLGGNPRDMGQYGLPMSVLVKTKFLLYADNAYIHYFLPKPTDLQINATLFEFVDFTGLNELLINIESLGDFDPAIFTAVRNYYYEDVAIMMPADQRLSAPDEDENEKDKNKEEKKL